MIASLEGVVGAIAADSLVIEVGGSATASTWRPR